MLQLSPYVLPTVASLLVSIWMVIAIWSRRPGQGVNIFVTMTLALVLWTFSSIAEQSTTTFAVKSLFTPFLFIGITIVPAAWYAFVQVYTGHDNWLTNRKILLLSIEPVLVFLCIITDPVHHLFWISRELIQYGDLLVIDYVNGPAFWVHGVYSYALIVIATVQFIRAFIKSPEVYRGQMGFLLLGIFAPWIANAVYLSGFSPLPKFVDLTPMAFTITAVALGWSLYRYRLMDLIPVARDAIIENMSDGVLVLDKTNRIVDANRAVSQILNKNSTTLIGKTAIEALSDYSRLLAQYRDVERADTEITVGADEQARTYNMRISPLYNRQQDLSGRIIVLHDITSLKETNNALRLAQQKAEEATQLKSQFLATMSHELRTPLNAIIGYTELQLEGMVGELTDEQYGYNERVLANGLHLLGLINDILDLSKIEAGRMELLQEPFNVNEWFTGIVQQNAILADSKGITFETNVDPALPAIVVGDEVRLKQIAINLISNAIKFTHTGSVTFELKRQGEETWQMVVTDTGIGIAPHKQETIFNEFQQGDSSSTREYGGTGLGLAIVRKLVLNMGGTIRLNSTLGEGSTFMVNLPLSIETEEAITA